MNARQARQIRYGITRTRDAVRIVARHPEIAPIIRLILTVEFRMGTRLERRAIIRTAKTALDRRMR